jgi:hypothetical protein
MAEAPMSTVGGRPFDYTKKQITDRMRGEQPEEPRAHVVEISGVPYPVKQVVGTVTGWDRTSFTSLEARRVLGRAGLSCRRVDEKDDDPDDPVIRDLVRRVEALEVGLASANQAIVKLLGRDA